MYIAINTQSKAAFWKIFGRGQDDSLAAAIGKPGAPTESADIALYETSDADLAACALADMVVTIDGGMIAKVTRPVIPTAYLHCDLSATMPDGAGGSTPVELFGLPAIRPNSTAVSPDAKVEDVLTALIALRAGPDPASPVLTAINGVFPINIEAESGGQPDQRAVTVTNGQATVFYRLKPGSPKGDYALTQNAVRPIPVPGIGTMQVVVVDAPRQFRVYEPAEQG